jgi:hypothetical protein
VVSVANLERSHFFSCLYGKSKEVYEKSYGASINRRWIGFSLGRSSLGEGAEDGESDRRTRKISGGEAAVMSPNALTTTRSTSPFLTLMAEAGESPAALIQVYFLAEASVLESQSACL